MQNNIPRFEDKTVLKFLDIIGEMLFVLDADKKIMDINPVVEKSLGYTEGELSGKTIDIFARDREAVEKLMAELDNKAAVSGIEFVFTAKSGDKLSVLLSACVSTGDDGAIDGYMIAVSDKSEYKAMEQELSIGYSELTALNSVLIRSRNDLEENNKKLVKIDKLKNDFISMVSHELRTPLTSVIGFTKLIAKGAVGPITPRQAELMGIIDNNLARLLKLINELLDMSKMESGTFSINKGMCDLTKTIDMSVNDMALIAHSKDISLIKEYGDGKLRVNADSYRISQVLINLLNNAIKFSDPGGRIWIGISTADLKSVKLPSYVSLEGLKQGEYFRVCVRDEGIGIPEGSYEKVFERFYQIAKSSDSKPRGVGLGLPITRKIIGMHDGKIWAQQSGQGKGTEFVFIIPVE